MSDKKKKAVNSETRYKIESYADQLELIGILKNWNDAAREQNKTNPQLKRAIELVQNLIFELNRQELKITELQAMLSAVREEKNKEIMRLRGYT